MGTGWQEADIVRWECVRVIRDRDWRMRIVWTGQGPGEESRDGQPITGTAWFSFGAVDGWVDRTVDRRGDRWTDGRVRTFQRDLPEVTPDVTHHFVRLVIRFATAL